MGWLSKAFSSITGGDILGFAGGILGANSKNKANNAATQQSIAFEREKAQNAHQWEVDDLRKAGLNPILSAGGSGASTGSPTIIPAGESPFASGLNSANATRLAREQIDTFEKQQTGLKFDNDVKYAMAHTALALNGLLSDSDSKFEISTHNPTLEKFMTELGNAQKAGELLDAQIEAQKNENERSKRIAELYGTDFGYALAVLNELPWLSNFVSGAFNLGSSAIKKPNVSNSKHSHYHNTTINN